LQVFEGLLLVVFGMKSMKERINIILAFDKMFDLWYVILLAWEDEQVLDGIGLMPMNPTPFGKSMLSPFERLNEMQLIELTNDLLVQKVLLCNHPIGGDNMNIKTMLECSIM
jgi:hypothetical protein